ncbi:CHAT domain-containing protein [Nostoc sp. PCC 7107]|uniref:CHAT domain-containing protein n=1 Tax=Nostoc sp. PCC 7107 TaxID=317936 RepID=UPI00029EC9BF|nr:CHAT domain-containing protein [Nostoc sp. PCC 7107]AFY41887.1 filamentous hemagglutinin family outer membrane protein [Nostoc sp. PCC 7107]
MHIKVEKITSKLPIIFQQNQAKALSQVKILTAINIILGLYLIPAKVQAQNITPANDSTGTTVNSQGDISGGKLSSDKSNLFHSFSKFELDANQTANFLSQPSIQNILGRVTGGEASIINGIIRVSGGNSNLYLINPAGIIFGANAHLNVPASFTATTANRLGFGNNNWLNAVGSNNYSQLIGTPNSFAFDASVTSAIFNQGNLAVPNGNNLSLFGGAVVSTGTLSAPGGNVTIAAVPGSNLLKLSMAGNPLSLEIQPLNSTNNLASNSLPALLTGGDVGNASGLQIANGEVKLTGSGLTISNGDVVSTANIVAQNVTIQAAANITTQDIITNDKSTGLAGTVNLTAGDNITTNNIDASAFSRFETAMAGAVNLTAGGNITTNNIDTSAALILGTASAGAVNLIADGNITVGSINTSAISIDVEQIELLNANSPNQAGILLPNTPPFAQGGNVNLLANGTVRVVGEIIDNGQLTGNSILTSAFTQPGAVKIQHDGGVNNVPFIVGDANLNGTKAAINVSQVSLFNENPTIENIILDSNNSQIAPTSPIHIFPVLPLGGRSESTPSLISINSVNTPPIILDNYSVINTRQNRPITFTFGSLNINTNDVNNDVSQIIFDGILSGSVSFQDGTPVTSGTVLSANTVLVYTPQRGSVGKIPAFNIKASDGVSESAPQSININITRQPIIITPPNPDTDNPSPNPETNNSPPVETNNSFHSGTNNLLNIDLTNNVVNSETEEKKMASIPIVEKDQSLLDVDIDKEIAKIDARFTNQFAQYLGTATPPIKGIKEASEILVNIENSTGVKPALIYVSFIPKTLKRNVLPEQKLTPQADDILELLVVTGKGEPIRKVVNVTRSQVLAISKQFTNNVTQATLLNSYITPATKLYNWLIAPLKYNLQARQINNLVFIVDAGLRTMPIAALYDGKQYLIENYSVGLMPSLSLTDTQYIDIKKSEVLGMGASQFMNQDPLPSVPSELTTITQKLWPGRAFLNEAFTLTNLKAQRQQKAFGIVHLATHGEFNSGAPNNSYIQLWDTQLRMDQIRQLGWNNPPVELVVLSACRTALGNEDAELGFAGFAVQAGTKSALASLWYVSDEGTLGLMTQFYEKLKQAPIKAEALRRAQVAMLKGQVRIEMGRLRTARGDVALPPVLLELGDRKLTHPYFWAAFTMIGNPW